jgi:hypothetical protein
MLESKLVCRQGIEVSDGRVLCVLSQRVYAFSSAGAADLVRA